METADPSARTAHVLVVDDDPKFTGFVSSGLADCGHTCSTASGPDEAETVLASGRGVDVILLDVMMPGRSGWDFLASLRAAGNEVPVIFVTARDAVDERVKGLGLGADDYIIKPFAFQELLARIQAVLRRREAVPTLRHGELLLEPATRQTRVGDRRLELPPKEFDVLRALLDARGGVLSRKELLDRVWGIGFDPGTNVVDVCIARLRRHLKSAGWQEVETVVGEGYRVPLPVDEGGRCMNGARWSLRNRIRLTFALAIGGTSLLIGAVSLFYLHGSLAREMRALCTEELGELQAHYDASGFDREHFADLVAELQRSHPRTPMAWRFTGAGLAEPWETGLVSLLPPRGSEPPIEAAPVALSDQRWMAIDRLGPDLTVEAVLDGQSHAAFLLRYQSFAAVLLLCSSLLAYGVGHFVAGRVSRWLSEVATRARSVRSLEAVALDQPDAPDEIRDVSEALEEMLGNVRAEYERNRLLIAGLAHELRSPIQNISGETEVALLMERSAEDYRRVLESHLEEIRGLGDAVDNLVTLCSQQDPFGAATFEDFDLDAEARLRLRREQAIAERRGVDLSIEGSGPLTVHADREAVLRAVRNLVANAVEWTDAGKHVDVRLEGRNGTVEVIVDDEGPGIPLEEREKIVQPFYRGPTANGRRAGFGLGLALAHGAAKAHGGSLEVGETPAGGARMVLRLPRRPAGDGPTR